MSSHLYNLSKLHVSNNYSTLTIIIYLKKNIITGLIYYFRQDYDEFSRQDRIPVPSDQSSEESSPRGGNNSPANYQPRYSPHGISVSPNEEYLSAQSPSAFRLLSRETVTKGSPIGSPLQREYVPRSPPYQRDHASQRSPVSSPYHQETVSPFRTHRPGRKLRIPDQGNEEQVFDFEGEPYSSRKENARAGGYYENRYENTRTEDSYDIRYEQNRPYSGDEKYQYYSQERQNSGDFQPDTAPSGYAPILSGKNRYQYDHYSHPNQVEEQSGEVMHDYSQPPTTTRPRSSRPKSARKRPQSARKKKQEEQYVQQDDQNTQSSGNSPFQLRNKLRKFHFIIVFSTGLSFMSHCLKRT